MCIVLRHRWYDDSNIADLGLNVREDANKVAVSDAHAGAAPCRIKYDISL